MRAWTALLLALSGPAFASLPGGLSGAWYNPAQSGHGVSIEVLSEESALIFWYTYDKSGAPLTLYTEGRISDQSIVGSTLAPSGMRFGEFRREDLIVRPWGTLRIDFVDCDHATFSYDAIDANYGEGAFPLRRLTRIKDSTCVLGFPSRLKTGLYKLRSEVASNEWHVAVDSSGVMHGVLTFREPDGMPTQPTQVTNGPVTQFVGTPRPVDANSSVANYELALRTVTWHTTLQGLFATSGLVKIDENGHGDEVRIPLSGSGTTLYDFEGLELRTSLQPDLTLAALAGTYRLRLVRFLAENYEFQINADGSICHQALCGRITLGANNDGLFQFTLPDAGGSDEPGDDYRGTGWLEITESGERELVLVGISSTESLGIVAKRVAP